MNRLLSTSVAAAFLFACGGNSAPTRTSDLGELWISTEQAPDGSPNLEIDFGAVPTGARRSIKIDGFNAGIDPIAVTAIQFDQSTDGSYYLNAPPLPVELVSGERFSFSVTFAPGTAGESTSRIVLSSTGRTAGAQGLLHGVGE